MDYRNFLSPGDQFILASVVLIVILELMLYRRWGHIQPRIIQYNWKFSLFIQPILQLLLYIYWGFYVPRVWERMPLVLAQLWFAYLLDAIWCLARRRPITLGFAPMPIILSINLFAWVKAENLLFNVAVIAIAIGAKAVVRWKDGRHIFNPSAVGISVIALCHYFAPVYFPYTDIAHLLSLPPNMFEVIVLLSIIPQIRIGTAAASFGAMDVLVGWSAVGAFLETTALSLTGGGGPPVSSIVLILTLTFFATDPATIPRGVLGRYLFGAILGILILATRLFSIEVFESELPSKILPVMVANLCVPFLNQIDTLVTRTLAASWAILQAAMQRGEFRKLVGALKIDTVARAPALAWLLEQRRKRPVDQWAITALWLLLITTSPQFDVKDRLGSIVQAREHLENRTPHMVLRSDNTIHPEDNPVFIHRFTFVEEVKMWLREPAEMKVVESSSDPELTSVMGHLASP